MQVLGDIQNSAMGHTRPTCGPNAGQYCYRLSVQQTHPRELINPSRRIGSPVTQENWRTDLWIERISPALFNFASTIRQHYSAGQLVLACTQQTHCGMHASIFLHTRMTTWAGSLVGLCPSREWSQTSQRTLLIISSSFWITIGLKG